MIQTSTLFDKAGTPGEDGASPIVSVGDAQTARTRTALAVRAAYDTTVRHTGIMRGRAVALGGGLAVVALPPISQIGGVAALPVVGSVATGITTGVSALLTVAVLVAVVAALGLFAVRRYMLCLIAVALALIARLIVPHWDTGIADGEIGQLTAGIAVLIIMIVGLTMIVGSALPRRRRGRW